MTEEPVKPGWYVICSFFFFEQIFPSPSVSLSSRTKSGACVRLWASKQTEWHNQKGLAGKEWQWETACCLCASRFKTLNSSFLSVSSCCTSKQPLLIFGFCSMRLETSVPSQDSDGTGFSVLSTQLLLHSGTGYDMMIWHMVETQGNTSTGHWASTSF